jgi:Kdo2-lipid IVA lauroyltransferase/acyltransferase
LQAVAYYISLPFIYLISLLPFPALFVVSDFMFFMLYRVTGYRKGVVLQNLRNAFPEKSDAEINKICKEFYHTLCDFTLETLKILTISKKEILKHCNFTPEAFELFSKYGKEGKSIIMVLGHLGNWEWAGHPFSIRCPQKLVVIYHPLTNKYFDNLMLRMRSRNGTKMIPMKTAIKDMIAHRKDVTCTVFLSDQTPMPEGAYWTTFLNQDTPVFKGTEVIAKKMNLPIVYAWMTKPKRGYYTMHAETLVENPAATADGEITELHTRRLERDIIENPGLWLWSHRRWKHKRPADKTTNEKQA